MTIQVKKGDITDYNCHAIVNPANSQGYMGGGVAGAIKRVGGNIIEQEALSQAPISIGKAIATTSGNLPCKYVIHAPTMKYPAMKIPVTNVELATRAALELGIKLNIKTIVIPGMGTGVGRVPVEEAAKTIVKTIKDYEDRFDQIILIDRNEKMIKAFKFFINK